MLILCYKLDWRSSPQCRTPSSCSCQPSSPETSSGSLWTGRNPAAKKLLSVSQLSFPFFCFFWKPDSQISSPGHLPHSLSIIPPCTCLLSARPANHADDRDDQEDHDDPHHHKGFWVHGYTHDRQRCPIINLTDISIEDKLNLKAKSSFTVARFHSWLQYWSDLSLPSGLKQTDTDRQIYIS